MSNQRGFSISGNILRWDENDDDDDTNSIYNDINILNQLHEILDKDMIPATGFNFQIENYSQKVQHSDGPIFTTVSTAYGTTSQLKLDLVGKSKTLMEIFYLIDEPGFLQMKLLCKERSSKMTQLAEIEWSRIPAKAWQYLSAVTVETVKENYIQTGGKLVLSLQMNRLDTNASRTVPYSLSESFRRLMNSTEGSDVEIVSSDGRSFKAHKLVLMSRSAVFAAMLNSGMREAKSSVIILDDINAHLLEELLAYLYTDRCPGMTDKSQELLHVADKYQLDGLKSLSEEAVFGKITPENAIKILMLSDMYNAHDLKKRVLTYIKEGPTKDMLKSKEWKAITSCELLRNLIEQLLQI